MLMALRSLCPDLARQESREFHVQHGAEPGLVAGTYRINESFCAEAGCDCRRVMFTIASIERRQLEATIIYGWESEEFYAHYLGDDSPVTPAEMKGPLAVPCGPQGACGSALQEYLQHFILTDEVYMARVRAHHDAFKKALARGDRRGRDAALRPQPDRVTKVGRNAPCPCGSGRKHKKCCGREGTTTPVATGGGSGTRRGRRRIPRLPPGDCLVFHVSLVNLDPPIFRRIMLRADASFEDLHRAIQDCGWEDAHLWEFRNEAGMPLAGPASSADPLFPGLQPVPRAEAVPLTAHFMEPGDSCLYEYDMGDSWLHGILLEKLDEQPEPFERALLDGSGAFPPEDCGGAAGFERLRIFRRTGQDPWGRPEELEERYGRGDFESFDLSRAQQAFGTVLARPDSTAAAPEAPASGPPAAQIVEAIPARPRDLDRESMERLICRADEILGELGEQLGLKVEVGRGSYRRLNGRFEITVSTVRSDGLVMDKDASEFLERCQEYGLAPEDLGRAFNVSGEHYRVVGLRSRAKQAVVCERILPDLARGGRRVRFNASTVRTALELFSEQGGPGPDTLPPTLEAGSD